MHAGLTRVLVAFAMTAPGLHAETLSAGQQTALVRKYCAVCHTDSVKNGGLSLQHYDAAVPDAPLAAMLLSKLKGGAMSAAGLPTPDPATSAAWTAATVAQAERAKMWSVIRAYDATTNAPVLVASIVRDAPRPPDGSLPLYRLSLSCNTTTHKGEIQLAWSPQPQTDRTFSVSADGNQPISQTLEGTEQKMGNGSPIISGLAAATLKVRFPERALTVTDLFPGETVEFPISDLDSAVRRDLGVCLSSGVPK